MIPICICLIEPTSYMTNIFNMFYPVGFLFLSTKTVEEIETVLINVYSARGYKWERHHRESVCGIVNLWII